jgi:hypothetical protein
MSIPPVPRQEKSAAQDLAFGRRDLECVIRFIRSAGFPDAVADLQRVLDALPPATVFHLGCRTCNGDVPLDQPDLVEDNLCRPCADRYDAAASERRRHMREARALRIAA